MKKKRRAKLNSRVISEMKKRKTSPEIITRKKRTKAPRISFPLRSITIVAIAMKVRRMIVKRGIFLIISLNTQFSKIYSL